MHRPYRLTTPSASPVLHGRRLSPVLDLLRRQAPQLLLAARVSRSISPSGGARDGREQPPECAGYINCRSAQGGHVFANRDAWNLVEIA